VRLYKTLICLAVLFVIVIPAVAQQDYVARFDAYGSYSFLSTSKLNLFERGFHGQFGVNWKTWAAIGGDFSVFTGHSSLFPFMLNNEKKTALATAMAPIAPYLPPGYKLYVPYDVTTYTFTVGPQINVRKLKWATFFIHPSLGGMHQDTTTRPQDMVQKGIVAGLLGSSPKTSDTVLFYGFGGGLELNVHKHMSIRMTSDFVHTGLYSDMLAGGENNVRFSIGPAFHFGKNIVK
jgi:Outer membrane protein beta-barrel domain